VADSPILAEFAPAPARATARTVLGIALTAIIVPATVFAAALLWLPHRIEYTVESGGLVVTLDRTVWSRQRHFALADVVEARAVTLSRGRRVSGTSLPGYCVGTFRYRELGDVWQATDCTAAAVILRLRGSQRPIVLAPGQRDAFLAALSSGTAATFAPADTGEDGTPLALRLLVLLPIPLVFVIPVLFLLAPSRLRYRVGPGTLEVRTLLLRRRFRIFGATARRHVPTFGIKLVGSGMPGYHTGWFMVDGQRTRVYATTTQGGVLIEDGTRIFVTPADPDAFLDALTSVGTRRE
jgi:hypothetical protein